MAAETPYLGLEHIERGGRILASPSAGDAKLASTKFSFDQRHILFGKLRPNLGKIARPSFEGICSTDILPILPGPDLDRAYLHHFLAQPSMVDFAASRTSGANLPRLSPTVLATFEIPLPPLEEQRRIAAILDQADALRAKRRQAVAHLDDLNQTIFRDMFGESGVPGANAVRLADFGDWRSGGTPPRARTEYFSGDLPWYSSGELGPLYVATSAERITSNAVTETSAKLVPAGSILVGMYDTAALKSSITRVPASCNQAVAFSHIDSTKGNSLFVYFAIQAARVRVLALRRGIRQKNLNLSMVREISIPRASLASQDEFAAKVNGVLAQRALAEMALRVQEELFASAQSRAFRGEL